MAILKRIKSCFSFSGSGFLFLLIFAVVFRLFIIEPFVVKGSSMEPNFHNGDYLWIEKISTRASQIKRGEVIIFKAPDMPGSLYIKRVVGLPKERIKIYKENIYIIKDNNVYKLSEPEIIFSTLGSLDIVLAEDEYFVMGDNRNVSEDSRYFGPIKKSTIIGKAWIRLLPKENSGLIKVPFQNLEIVEGEEAKKILESPSSKSSSGLNSFLKEQI